MDDPNVVFCPHCEERNELTRSYCKICFKALVLPEKVGPIKKCLNKLKELWSKAVFRWCVYQTPLLVFGLLLKGGVFDLWGEYKVPTYHFLDKDLSEWWVLIWILILAIPAVWVWRKPLFSWLNKKAEEG